MLFSCFKLNSLRLLSQGKINKTLPTHRLVRMALFEKLFLIVKKTFLFPTFPHQWSKSCTHKKIPLKGWKLQSFHSSLETSENRVKQSKEALPMYQSAKKSPSVGLPSFWICGNFIIPVRQKIWRQDKNGFAEIVPAWDSLPPGVQETREMLSAACSEYARRFPQVASLNHGESCCRFANPGGPAGPACLLPSGSLAPSWDLLMTSKTWREMLKVLAE